MMTDRKLMGIRARVPIDVRLGMWRLSHFASRTTSLPQSSWTARKFFTDDDFGKALISFLYSCRLEYRLLGVR